MSFQNNNAADAYQDFMLPTALNSDFSSEDLADDMDGLQMTMQRVKIPGGGNLQFEIRSDDPDNPDYERKLVGVILYHHLANAYWPEGSEYDDNVAASAQPVHSTNSAVRQTAAEKPAKICGRSICCAAASIFRCSSPCRPQACARSMIS